MNNETLNTQYPMMAKEETWFLQECLTVGLKLLYMTTEGCERNEAVYVFIHRYLIVRIRVKISPTHGIYSHGHVEQIGHTHYKEGEFGFDARPKEGLVFAVQDERKTIDTFLSFLNGKLLDPDINNVF